jgi:quercetin dioxygenase-like cupin family protein
MSAGFEVRRIDELPEIPVSSAGINWRPIRRTFGISAFGVNAYTGEPGQTVVEEHTEERLGHEELYVVVAGRARFELDGESVDAPAGTLVYLRDPAVKRHAVAEEPGTTVLAVGGKPGEAFEPSPWEWWFEAAPLAERGDWRAAADFLARGLEEYGEHPALVYNLACYEAQAGRLDEATAHARRALELDPTLREWALEDADLEAIRDRL